MTEFESAQLVYMQAERAGNLMSLIQAQGELIQNDATQFTTLIFGYLLVAYFIGSHLTKVQVVILNTLYIASVGSTVFQMVTGGLTAMGFLERFYEVSENTRELSAMNPDYLLFGVALNIALIIASLYFMWSVRHPKTEPPL
jgi:predicted neutral ceramidase superfamily lipid hydrolase